MCKLSLLRKPRLGPVPYLNILGGTSKKKHPVDSPPSPFTEVYFHPNTGSASDPSRPWSPRQAPPPLWRGWLPWAWARGPLRGWRWRGEVSST